MQILPSAVLLLHLKKLLSPRGRIHIWRCLPLNKIGHTVQYYKVIDVFMEITVRHDIHFLEGKIVDWVCLCGNTAKDQGFYPCNYLGVEVAAFEFDCGCLYRCRSCKRSLMHADYFHAAREELGA